MPPPRRLPLMLQTAQSEHTSGADKEQIQLKRSSAVRKSVRFTPSTNGGSEKDELSPQEPADTDILTRSPHASRGSVSSIELPAHLQPPPTISIDPSMELLKPVTYSPDSSQNLDERVAAALETGIIRSDTVRHKVGVLEYSHRALPQLPQADRSKRTGLQVETESHKRNLSSSSIGDRARRKKAVNEIYFTPTDVNSSKTLLSSPLNSPTRSASCADESEDDMPTPRAFVSASMTRPPSAIYVGPATDEARLGEVDHDNTVNHKTDYNSRSGHSIMQITPEQLDKLVIALAQSKLIRKHLSKDWFNLEGVPDNDSIVSSFSSVSLPTLTSASSLYSRQNDNSSPPTSDGDELPRYNSEDPHLKLPYREPVQKLHVPGGITLCDPKIYGTPAKFVSMINQAALGSRTFLPTLDTSDMECSLRIEYLTSQNTSVQVFLQCVNQIVDRKSGKQASMLCAEVNVTERIIKAALAELAEAASLQVKDIAVCTTPTNSTGTDSNLANSPSSQHGNQPSLLHVRSSSFIDWIAVADDLQQRDHISTMIDSALSSLHNLSSESAASTTTLNLLAHLSCLADQYHDLLILKPTSYHPDKIMPHTIKIPYCSRRLYEDWYTDPRGSQAGEKVGESDAARLFQRGIVSDVAKRAGEKESFKIEVFWENGGRVRQVLRVVPMVGGQGQETLWCCFVLGEKDLSG